ncbi:hypothetical protein EIP91_002804 [Steccherinum ochraceum]|uniref:Uncharacterized protein n=1 Tax=Steccherinum ochraceum TaxID=92696 RepID=A0A4R0RN88_9APHY|nr:hypothetical protein EIP91_002804 [Steccherinum ochraceum]
MPGQRLVDARGDGLSSLTAREVQQIHGARELEWNALQKRAGGPTPPHVPPPAPQSWSQAPPGEVKLPTPVAPPPPQYSPHAPYTANPAPVEPIGPYRTVPGKSVHPNELHLPAIPPQGQPHLGARGDDSYSLAARDVFELLNARELRWNGLQKRAPGSVGAASPPHLPQPPANSWSQAPGPKGHLVLPQPQPQPKPQPVEAAPPPHLPQPPAHSWSQAPGPKGHLVLPQAKPQPAAAEPPVIRHPPYAGDGAPAEPMGRYFPSPGRENRVPNRMILPPMNTP